MPMGVIAGVIGLFQVVKAGIDLTRSFNNAFDNSDPSRLNFGQASTGFVGAVENFNQQLSRSTQERREQTADEKRRLELEQMQLDQHNRFNFQEQFTLPEFFEPRETTYPT
jgi:hypothetical protein